MPAPTGNAQFLLADVGPILGRPLLFMLGLFLFLYITCEVGVWNWLPRHLIAQGIPESRALNILSLGFALGLLIGRVGVSPILAHVPAIEVTLGASIAMAVTTFLMLQNEQAWPRFRAGVHRGTLDGSGLSHHARHYRDCISAHDRHRARLRHHLRMGWPRGQFADHRRHRRRRPERLKKALLLFPASAVLMVVLNLAIWSALR